MSNATDLAEKRARLVAAADLERLKLGLAWRDIIPWWLVGILVAREVFMAIVMLRVRSLGQIGLPVHFVGKAATFNLLYAFPLLLLADGQGRLAEAARIVGWGFAWWGIGLYVVSAVIYLLEVWSLASRRPRAA